MPLVIIIQKQKYFQKYEVFYSSRKAVTVHFIDNITSSSQVTRPLDYITLKEYVEEIKWSIMNKVKFINFMYKKLNNPDRVWIHKDSYF